MGSVSYQSIASEAQKRRDDAIAAFYPDLPSFSESDLPNDLTEWATSSKYYTTEELEIIESDAEDILQKIRDRIWTSSGVTKAFCKASALAQKLVSGFRVLYCTAALILRGMGFILRLDGG
jgi:amidase